MWDQTFHILMQKCHISGLPLQKDELMKHGSQGFVILLLSGHQNKLGIQYPSLPTLFPVMKLVPSHLWQNNPKVIKSCWGKRTSISQLSPSEHFNSFSFCWQFNWLLKSICFSPPPPQHSHRRALVWKHMEESATLKLSQSGSWETAIREHRPRPRPRPLSSIREAKNKPMFIQLIDPSLSQLHPSHGTLA